MEVTKCQKKTKTFRKTRTIKRKATSLQASFSTQMLTWIGSDLKKFLKDDWNIVPQDDVKDNAMVFKVGDMVVACSLMPNPVPNKEAENAAKYNILWKEGANEVAKHQAHVMLAVMNKTRRC